MRLPPQTLNQKRSKVWGMAVAPFWNPDRLVELSNPFLGPAKDHCLFEREMKEHQQVAMRLGVIGSIPSLAQIKICSNSGPYSQLP